ncbi:hypothetical protein N7468_007588 [Penicillium chermesinum]|uniref:Xylanolytic transcriptional activator regulatory domain-containing protein n=1 Tax=Penicillium chermesinum TaxID=63820 RepID=A0A9W9NUQ6_9EURO|nr:uncharacterized protein N7468_007588 [Penicillium chermesinum]KAJ5226363.1 hypothetical protein N7468_007588 [Penicillium chermesinum]
MSAPSPKKKSSGNTSGPRQIRFVATDGQPQTKRRRVNAAYLFDMPPAQDSVFGRTTRYDQAQFAEHVQIISTFASDTPIRPRTCDPNPTPRREDRRSRSSKVPTIPATHDTQEQWKAALRNLRMHRPRMYRPRMQRQSRQPREPPMRKIFRREIPRRALRNPTLWEREILQKAVVQIRGSRKSNTSLSSGSSTATRDPHDLFNRLMLTSNFNLESQSPSRSPKIAEGVDSSLPTILNHRDDRYNNIPFYDRDDSLPVPELVSHLVDLFFTHLGCNFPFLQRERFLQDLKDKKADTMLVDAVCSLAARFSPHPLLASPQAPPIDSSQAPAETKMSDRSLPFTHRAMSALIDSLSCPTLTAVQACLLLAYDQFGSNHDSGLWMYLGISIRMAQDLGLQKHQGLKYNYGSKGVTPNEVMSGQAGKLREDQYDDFDTYHTQQPQQPNSPTLDTERARERERVDTFWSIFFLDRVISSGTGRPVTLRDEDIELCFPLQSESQLANGWPAPFPPLIRVIHLYGRVTDLINSIQAVKHVTSDTLKRLAGMESDLTGIYQRLSPRLHFNAANFQAYVKAKEGTNFILLHFWFHTLIVLLHQPTLLNSFGGTIQHLYPNSRELSMSSAKTIADILSFSELVDGKSFIGNPFTSQPMYIAACAFLMESAYYSLPSSQSTTPPAPQALLAHQSSGFVLPTIEPTNGTERKATAKHILLASAARENYQRCYKALKALDAYWEGTGYILTVLDQKAKGIVDPLLYAAEDYGQSAESTPFGPSAWPSKAAEVSSTGRASGLTDPSDGESPKFDPSQAIGWALTGATDSSQPNLSLLYQMPTTEPEPETSKPTYSSQYSHSFPALPVQANSGQAASSSFPSSVHSTGTLGENQASTLAAADAKFTPVSPRPLGTDSPYYMGQSSFNQTLPPSQIEGHNAAYAYPVSSGPPSDQHIGAQMNSRPDLSGGMMIESHDVDMNSLHHQESFPFSHGEIIPWLEYLPQDVLNFFGENQNFSLMTPEDTNPRPAP